MRSKISELEFQFALMMGYYSYFAKSNEFNFYLPTPKEEHDKYAADWVYKDTKGICLYLQFKKSDLMENITNKMKSFRAFYSENTDKIYQIHLYNKKDGYRQHNMLYNKNDDGSIGCYVAPIFNTHLELKCISDKKIDKNYSYKMNKEMNTINLKDFGFFENVIYIKPHDKITDKGRHSYCFNKKREVSFNSKPQGIAKKYSLSFEELLDDIKNKILLRENNTTTLIKEAEKQFDEIMIQFLGHYRNSQLDDFLNNVKQEGVDLEISQIKKLKKEGQTQEYVYRVSQLYKKAFNIQTCFIYPKL